MRKLITLLIIGFLSVSVWGQNTNKIETTGNVGIGTISPSSKLHVEGGDLDIGNINAEYSLRFRRANDGNAAGSIRLYNSNEFMFQHVGGGGYYTFLTNFGSTVTEKMRIANNGYVGIGTDNPSRKLQVHNGVIKTSNSSHLGGWEFNQYGYIAGTYETGEKNVIIRTYGDSYFKGGNLGVGTNSPQSKLHVVGGNLDIGSTTGEYFLRFRRKTDNGAISQIGLVGTNEFQFKHSGGGSFYTFHTNSGGVGERMRIANNGNVGIGTESPDYKLDVCGTIRAKEVKVEEFTCSNGSFNGTLAVNNITYTSNGQTADFVFSPTYNLKTLSEVESFIKANKHLPEMPSAAQMEEQGVNLAEMNKLLLQKVEELTLYAIQQKAERNKEKERLSEALGKEQNARSEMEERLEKLEALLQEITSN